LLPVEGEIFFLTSPFIDQAISLKFRVLSIHLSSGAFESSRKMSVMAWIRKLTISELCVVQSLPQCFHDQTDKRIGSGICKNNQIERHAEMEIGTDQHNWLS
jgi:hypothetical protein